MRASQRRILSLALAGGSVALSLASAAGQTSTWLNVEGNWSDLANWDRANVPNTCGEQAILGGTTLYRVNLDGQWSVGEVRVDNALAQVRILNGQFLRVCGFDGPSTRNGLTNNGTITVNSTAGPNATYISFDDNSPINGTGSIVLNTSIADNTTAYIQTANTSVQPLIGAGQTIRGAGSIYGRYTLAGLIRADSVDTRFLAVRDCPLTATGAGRIEVADGARLALVGNADIVGVPIVGQGSSIVTIHPNSSNEVSLTNLSVTSNTRIFAAADPFFSNVSLTGQVTLENDSRCFIGGDVGLTLNGSVTINATAGAGTTYMRFDQSGNLAGTGEIVLNASLNDVTGTAYLSHLNSSIITTIGSGITIRGTGTIYGAGRWNLAGIIRADAPDGRRLYLYESPLFGSGSARVEVGSTSILRIQGGDLTDLPIVGQPGSRVEFADQSTNPILTRVTATTSGEQLNGTTYFGDCTWNGTYRIANNANFRFGGANGLTLNGEITVNASAGPNASLVSFDQTTSLRGNGTITLNSSVNDNNTAYVQCANSGIVATLEPGITVRGTGRMYGTYNLGGALIADRPGLYFMLYDGTTTGTTPNARIEIRSNARLRMQGAYLVDARITGQPDAVLEFANQSRAPGLTRVNVNTPQTDILNGEPVWTDCNVTGNVRVANNAALRVAGANGLVNNGTILINPTSGTNGTYLILNESCTIGGAGSITLNAFPSNFDTSYIQLAADNLTGTFGPQQALRGTGNVYRRWFNQGLLSPGRTDQTDTIGRINVVNGYLWTQGPTSRMEMEVGGTQAAQFDRLTGGGSGTNIVLDGTLNLRLVPGYQPNQGDTFAIISGGNISGRFNAVNYPPGYTGSIVYPTASGQPVTVSFRRVLCVADFDDGTFTGTRDNGVTIDDLLYYLFLFEAGLVEADVDDGTGTNTPDAGVTIDDLLYFLQRFEAGC